MARIEYVIIALLLAVTPAMAQKERNAPTGRAVEVPAPIVPVPDALPAETLRQLKAGQGVDILQLLHDDANAALQDANANQDTLASSCYQAIITVTEAKIAAQNAPGGGVIFVFQKVRDITRLNASPLGLTLISGCAALVQDAKISFLDFFTKIGAAVLLKGVLL